MFNITEFLQTATISLGALLPVILALVSLMGKFGLKGKAQLAGSLLAGLVLGGATMYFQMPATTPAQWFSVVLFGLLSGLTASGTYEVGKELVSKRYSGSHPPKK